MAQPNEVEQTTMDEQVSEFVRLAEEAVALVLLPIEGVTHAPVTVQDGWAGRPEVRVRVYWSGHACWQAMWTWAGIRNSWPSPELLIRDVIRKLEARVREDMADADS